VIRPALIALVALAIGVLTAIGVADAGASARPATATHKRAAHCKPASRRSHHRRHASCRAKPKHRTTVPAARPKPTATTTVPSGVTLTPTTTVPTTTTTTTTTTPPPAPPAPLPSRLGVDEREYSVYPTHDPVANGSVEFNVTNFGQDDHDLTIARDGATVAQLAVVHPGETQTLVANLGPGTYKLYCSLYDHDALGMHATLVVQ
jgi:plastocyanin